MSQYRKREKKKKKDGNSTQKKQGRSLEEVCRRYTESRMLCAPEEHSRAFSPYLHHISYVLVPFQLRRIIVLQPELLY
jgi:hypothetical protein